MNLFILVIFTYLVPVNSPIYNEIKSAKSTGLIEVDLSCLPIDTRSIKILRKPRNETEKNFIKRLKSQTALSFGIQEDRGDASINIEKKNFFWSVNLTTKSSGRMRHWKGNLEGEFSRAGINLFTKNTQVIIGRDFIRWGVGEEHFPILSGETPSFDMIYFNWTGRKYINFAFFTSVLEPVFEDSVAYNRYISGHKIKFSNSKFSLYFTESVLYGGEDRQIEPYYLNPFMIYYATQWNNNYDDNVLWDIELCYNLKTLDKVYGGLFIDDFQYNKTDYESPKLAFLGGFRKGFGASYLSFEYAMSYDWVYNHRIFWNRYIHYDKVIGDNNGPDFDMISLKYVSMTRIGHYTIKLFTRKKGDNSPWFKYHKGEKINKYFLTGVVEKRTGMDISNYIQTKNMGLDFSMGIYYAKNFENTLNLNAIRGWIRLNFAILFNVR